MDTDYLLSQDLTIATAASVTPIGTSLAALDGDSPALALLRLHTSTNAYRRHVHNSPVLVHAFPQFPHSTPR